MKVFLQRILQEIMKKKIILGTSDAWSTIHLSHWPSDRAWIYLRLTNSYSYPTIIWSFFQEKYKPRVIIARIDWLSCVNEKIDYKFYYSITFKYFWNRQMACRSAKIFIKYSSNVYFLRKASKVGQYDVTFCIFFYRSGKASSSQWVKNISERMYVNHFKKRAK